MKFRRVVFEIRRANRRTGVLRRAQWINATDRQTDEQTNIPKQLRCRDVTSITLKLEWSFQKARRQMKQMKPKKKRKHDVAVSRPLVVIPYVEKVSETVARIMKKYNVLCAMKPWVTLQNVLVHPKDREDKK